MHPIDFKHYCRLIELRLRGEVLLSRLEGVSIDRLRLFNEVVDGVLNYVRPR